jgi:hypothetical protein
MEVESQTHIGAVALPTATLYTVIKGHTAFGVHTLIIDEQHRKQEGRGKTGLKQ